MLHSQEVANVKYVPGQKWKYETRPEEPDSTLTILRVETFPEWGTIVFIAVHDIRVLDKRADTGVRTDVGFTELTEEALERSVTELVAAGAAPEDQSFYDGWRRNFDAGFGGAYRETVREIIQGLQRLCDHANARADAQGSVEAVTRIALGCATW